MTRASDDASGRAPKPPTELETLVQGSLTDLQNVSDEATKKVLSGLKIASAKTLETRGLKVIIVTVPYKQIGAYQKLEASIVPSLEKKLEGTVILVAKRVAFPKTPRHGPNYRAIRPTGRTLRAVNEALLNDVVFPTTIVGKRVHYDLKGTPKTHVFLDVHDRTRAEERLVAFAVAYKALTAIEAEFQLADH